MKTLKKCKYFRDVTWTYISYPDNSTQQIMHCRCPKNSVAYLIKRHAYQTVTGTGYQYSFACSPQTVSVLFKNFNFFLIFCSVFLVYILWFCLPDPTTNSETKGSCVEYFPNLHLIQKCIHNQQLFWNSCWLCIHFWIIWALGKIFDTKMIERTYFSCTRNVFT